MNLNDRMMEAVGTVAEDRLALKARLEEFGGLAAIERHDEIEKEQGNG